MHNKKVHMVAFLLLVVGGLNWLLQGVFMWDIGMIFGGMESMISRAIYVLVGLAAIYELVTHKSTCKMCSGGGAPQGGGAPSDGGATTHG